jgi:hypothetical protein
MNTVSTRKAALGVSLGLLALLCAGCGGPATGTVSGTVTYKSKPVTAGFVTFVTERGNATGTIDDKGAYTVEMVPTGTAKVAVSGGGGPTMPKFGGKDKMKMTKDLPPEAEKMLAGAKQGSPAVTIPGKYSDANMSDLKVEVTSGRNSPFNIELKD